MDSREQFNDPEEMMRVAFAGLLSNVWTALPGIVQSYNADAQTVVVQPTIQGMFEAPNGEVSSVNMPLLPDVPVVFSRGGGATLTFPIKVGDECLVVFASRCIDGWWSQGGVQPQLEPRSHDLSDGFALVGPLSQARRLSGVSTSAVQLRADDGDSFIELNPTTGRVRILAPGGFEIVTPTMSVQDADGGQTNTSMQGRFDFIGEMTSNGKIIDDRHTHGGVQTGGGTTGTVT